MNTAFMTYQQATEYRDSLEAKLKECSAVMDTFPKGEFNLTPDAVKDTPEYKAARYASAVAFQNLREFNVKYLKAFKSEIKANRKYK